MTKGISNFGLTVLAVLGLGLLLLPLNMTHCYFYGDWAKILWGIAFAEKSYQTNFSFPGTVSSLDYIGFHFPVFYGSLFYPLTGFIGAFLGTDLALRVIIVFLFATQLFLSYRTFFLSTSHKWLSLSIALMISWFLYPQVNLFTRGSLPEFFAAICLSCAVLSFLNGVQSKSRFEFAAFLFLGALSYTLAFGSHPTVAMLSLPIVGIIYVLFLTLKKVWTPFGKKFLNWAPLVIGLSAFLVNLPWLLAVKSFMGRLPIGISNGINYYPEHYDRLKTRFFPIPYDNRSLFDGTKNEAPYMTLQIAMPLLFLILVIFADRKFRKKISPLNGKVLLSLILLFSFISWCSVSVTPFLALPVLFQKIQFLFRLITYQNLLLIVILFVMSQSAKEYFSRWEGLKGLALTAIFTVSLSGQLMRMNQNVALKVAMSEDYVYQMAFTVPTDYPLFDYVSLDYPPLDQSEKAVRLDVNFPLNTGAQFGSVDLVKFEANDKSIVFTNVSVFNWNILELDGVVLKNSELFKENLRFAFRVEPGTHSLRYRWEPDPTWRKFRNFSLSILMVSAISAVILITGLIYRDRHIWRI